VEGIQARRDYPSRAGERAGVYGDEIGPVTRQLTTNSQFREGRRKCSFRPVKKIIGHFVS
jgi:hypothetical protein